MKPNSNKKKGPEDPAEVASAASSGEDKANPPASGPAHFPQVGDKVRKGAHGPAGEVKAVSPHGVATVEISHPRAEGESPLTTTAHWHKSQLVPA